MLLHSHDIAVTLLADEDGMVGRECPSQDCGRYFKLKPGTGLETDDSHCPYCGTTGGSLDFATEDQIEYAASVAANQVLAPLLQDFERSMEDLNRRQRANLISLRLDVKRDPIRVHRYTERELQTAVACDNCNLEFVVYGVFASCPDCQRLNALATCLASLETARKRLLLSDAEGIDIDVRQQFPRDALGDVVSAFDAFGKALRVRFPNVLPAAAKSNLFQDLDALDLELGRAGMPDVAALAGAGIGELRWLFQARHLYEHNAGVIDARFVARLPAFSDQVGQLLPLPHRSLTGAIDTVDGMVRRLDSEFSRRS